MSGDWKTSVSRRPLLAALGALAGIGIVGGTAYEVFRLTGGGRPRGPYDDVLSLLSDRTSAEMVGRAVLAGTPAFQAGNVADQLRWSLELKPLAGTLQEDAAQNRIFETQGWVLPSTLAQLCALAAKAL